MLHPQARGLLDFIEQRGIPPTHTLSPREARDFYRERRFATQPPAPAVAHVQDCACTGRSDTPTRRSCPCWFTTMAAAL
jgi:acetyl esterase